MTENTSLRAPPTHLLECTPEMLKKFELAYVDRMTRKELYILIVEDVLLTRHVLRDMLLGSCLTEAVSNGVDGWNAYLKRAHDIIFLDIGLEDIPGHVLAERIRSIDPKAYIVMATGQSTVEAVEKAKLNLVDGYIVKPFNKKKVRRYVADYAAARKPRAAIHYNDGMLGG